MFPLSVVLRTTIRWGQQQAFLAVNPLDVACDPGDHRPARPRLKTAGDLRKEIHEIVRQPAAPVHEMQGIGGRAAVPRHAAAFPGHSRLGPGDTASRPRPGQLPSAVAGAGRGSREGQPVTGAENVVERGGARIALH